MVLIDSTKIDPDEPDRIERQVVVYGFDVVTDTWELPNQVNRKAHLVYVDTGLFKMETTQGVWIIPPQGAAWISSGVEHSIRASGDVKGIVAFVDPDRVESLPDRCRSVSVSPFLRALLERATEIPREYEPGSRDERLMGVLVDEMLAAPPEPFHLPLPIDTRLRKLADMMLAAPSEQTRLEEMARDIGMSERSMTRLFVSETGVSVGKWRRHMHVVAALPMLADGQSVQSVAHSLGYESPGAFVTMFRKAVGVPPRRFLSERTAGLGAPLRARREIF